MKRKIRHHNLFLSFFSVIFLISSPMGSGTAHGQETGPSDPKEVSELKERIFQLQEGNALLMENLMNCIEENDDLKLKLEKKSKTDLIDSNQDKAVLVESIREILRTDVDLSFLMKIEKDKLKVLLEVIKKAENP